MKEVGSHRNIVNMLGCCISVEPMYLVVEYLANGDLLNYLRKRRNQVCLQIYLPLQRWRYSLTLYLRCKFSIHMFQELQIKRTMGRPLVRVAGLCTWAWPLLSWCVYPRIACPMPEYTRNLEVAFDKCPCLNTLEHFIMSAVSQLHILG